MPKAGQFWLRMLATTPQSHLGHFVPSLSTLSARFKTRNARLLGSRRKVVAYLTALLGSFRPPFYYNLLSALRQTRPNYKASDRT